MNLATFQSCATTVITFIDSSQHGLVVGMCWFTNPAIFQAVQHARARNVQVKIVLDYDQINFHPRGLDFQALEKAGVVVLAYPGPGLLHYKFAVADDCRVLCGSYNWTRTEQCDHVIVLYDEVLAQQFLHAIETISAHCKPLFQLLNTAPRQISFAQLYRPTLWSIHDLRKTVVSGAKTWLVIARTEKDWQEWVSEQRHYLSINRSTIPWINGAVWDLQSFRKWLLTPGIRPTTRQLLSRYCLRMQQRDVLVSITTAGKLLGVGIVGSDPEIMVEKPDVVSRFVQWLVLPESDLAVKPPVAKLCLTRFKGSALELITSLVPMT